MLPVFLPLIGVQHIRTFRFTAAKVNQFAKDASLSINERSVFSNEFRTTRSTLKQAFSSRNVSIFAWFASLKLAVVLLTMLIIAAIAGTLYESSFDAKVARAYVYGAPWFNLWLVLLGANLACSAFS